MKATALVPSIPSILPVILFDASAAEPASTIHAGVPSAKREVLIVEDSKSTRLLAVEMLEGLGFVTREAATS